LKKGGCIKENKDISFNKGNFLYSNLLKNLENTPSEVAGLKDNIIAKIPIVLSRNNINFYLSYIINSLEDIEYIESIKNNLIFNKIILLKDANTLFLKGKVRKTIYYVPHDSSLVNKLKHFVVYIPFEISTNIDLDNEVIKDSEIYCEPLSSKIIDKLSVEKVNLNNKIIKNIMQLILQVDIIQNQFIGINSLDLKEYEVEEVKKDEKEREILDEEKNEGKLEPSLDKLSEVSNNNRKRRFILPPIKKSIRNKAMLLFLFRIFFKF